MNLDNIESPKDVPDAPIVPPLEVDLGYNVAVCTECTAGIAFDYIQSHLWSKHGIRKNLDDVMEYLNIEAPTLSSTEIEGWNSDVWVLNRGIQGVPVQEGVACKECHYSGAEKEAMKNHFADKHRGMKWSENIERCNVQMPFQGLPSMQAIFYYKKRVFMWRPTLIWVDLSHLWKHATR